MNRNFVLLQYQKPSVAVKGVFVIFCIASFIGIISSVTTTGSIISTIIFSLFAGAFTLRSRMYYVKDQKLLKTNYIVFGIVMYTQTERIPPIAYIALVRVVEHQTMSSRASTTHFSGVKFNLNLIFEKGSMPRYKTLETAEYDKVLIQARLLADASGKKINRTVGKSSNWIA